ncbi:unnamed protein product [Rhodiola kirilowii]
MDSFIVMHEWCSDLAPEEFKMNRLGVWAQMHNLPVGAMLNEKECGEKLARYVGKFIRVSQSETEGARKRFIRVRVEVEVDKPLINGFFLRRLNKDPLWISVKYERLPECCSKCGRLSHAAESCHYIEELGLNQRQGESDLEEGRRKAARGDQRQGEMRASQAADKAPMMSEKVETNYRKVVMEGLETGEQGITSGRVISTGVAGSSAAGDTQEDGRQCRTISKATRGELMDVDGHDGLASKTKKGNGPKSKLSRITCEEAERSVGGQNREEGDWHPVRVVWGELQEDTSGPANSIGSGPVKNGLVDGPIIPSRKEEKGRCELGKGKGKAELRRGIGEERPNLSKRHFHPYGVVRERDGRSGRVEVVRACVDDDQTEAAVAGDQPRRQS